MTIHEMIAARDAATAEMEAAGDNQYWQNQRVCALQELIDAKFLELTGDQA